MNVNVKKLLTITAAVLLLSAVLVGGAAALDKEEVVYVNMDASGNVEDVYVVNIFELEEPGFVVDYGEYQSVRNLVSTDTIMQTGDENTVYADKGRFFYQGNLGKAEIPWEINIDFFLDGRHISPEDIAGKSGRVLILLDICRNDAFKDKYFYQNLGMQVSLSLNAHDCTDIVAPGAVIANSGKNKQLTYTILPDKGGVYNITFDAVNFEMDAISINGIQMNMDIDVDLTDAKSMMRALSSATAELNTKTGLLRDGANDLNGTINGSTTGDQIGMAKRAIVYIFQHETTLFSDYCTTLGFSNNNDNLQNINIQSVSAYLNNKITNPSGNSIPEVLFLLGEIVGVADGAKSLSSSMELLKGGTSAIASSTSGMDKTLVSMVNEMLEPITGGDGYIRSFTSVKNVDIQSIQFAMHTTAIEMPEAVVVEEVEEELNFFQRILRLFGLY